MPAVVQIYLNYGTIYEYQTYLTYLVFGLFKCGMGGIFCTYQKYDESVNTDILSFDRFCFLLEVTELVEAPNGYLYVFSSL